LLRGTVGTDVRKVAVDGYPVTALLGAELQSAFIELGHSLFFDAPPRSALAPKFIIGDIFDPNFYDPTFVPTSDLVPAAIDSGITNLTSLKGTIRHIHAGSFFHLFDQATQATLARLVVSLLLRQPGSTIFGSHVGQTQAGLRPVGKEGGSTRMFCHNPASWTDLFEGLLGGKTKVKVDARLVERGLSGMAPTSEVNDWKGELLIWSVVLL
jgi:hypothetical protein